MHDYFLFITIVFLILSCSESQQQNEFKPTDELPILQGLPDPFLRKDGNRIKNKSEWNSHRTYLQKMLSHYMYGEMPPAPDTLRIEPISFRQLFNGQMVEEIFYVVLSRNGKDVRFKTGIRRPNKPGKFPIIIKNDSWLFNISEVVDTNKQQRYISMGRDKIEDWVAKEALNRKYIICKFNRNQVAPDHPKAIENGVLSLYPEYNWGTIAAWAWAYKLLIDYFEGLDYIDLNKIVATGHSRGGKTALCAGVYEDRIAVTAPSSSGAGGTASWKYFDNEHEKQLISHHKEHYPHWWTSRLYQFANKEALLPFDAHFQKALIAPRGLINVHSREDYWANPYGTYLTYLAADKVYNWLGVKNHQGIHWRNGRHNQNYEDWKAIFEFCDQYFFDKKSNIDFTKNPYPEKYTFDGLINYSG